MDQGANDGVLVGGRIDRAGRLTAGRMPIMNQPRTIQEAYVH
jgi:hypothetical protein